MGTPLREPTPAQVPSRPQLDDTALMTAIAARDQAAFARLYDRHSASTYALAYRLLGERDAAEGVVEAVFLALWHTPGDFAPLQGNVRAQLLTRVRRRACRIRAVR